MHTILCFYRFKFFFYSYSTVGDGAHLENIQFIVALYVVIDRGGGDGVGGG